MDIEIDRQINRYNREKERERNYFISQFLNIIFMRYDSLKYLKIFYCFLLNIILLGFKNMTSNIFLKHFLTQYYNS